MIIDLPKFLAAERRSWTELDEILSRLEADPHRRLGVEELKRFYFLYQKTSADLAKLSTFAFEPQVRRYLESLVARAYGEVHEARERAPRVSPIPWFFQHFPAVFQRHLRAFWLATAIFLAGFIFGGAALRFDPEAKPVLMPFEHLQGDPAKRVAVEEQAKRDRLSGSHSTFSADLMTHNIRVSLLTLGLGMTAGFGTVIFLFYNGVILGAVAVDYAIAGQMKFLLGWLLPHGVIEIPAILIAGQAGLLFGRAILGWSSHEPLRRRLRKISPDVMTLAFGLAVMLVWAGIVEAFFSQFHEPVLPYALKIAFGIAELAALILFLARKPAPEIE
ncbi:MAG: stage II sporulation protein M [Chthoniobacterales bacterium]